MTTQELKILRKLIKDLFGGKVSQYLDFACGTGRISYEIEKYCTESIGVDVSEKMLDAATTKWKKTKPVFCDVTVQEIELGQFDLITSFRFFGNADDHLRRSVLCVLYEKFDKDGYLIINNHRNPMSIPRILFRLLGGKDDMALTYWKLKSILVQEGFKIVQACAVGGWILMHRFQKLFGRRSRLVSIAEFCFRPHFFAPVSPDMVRVVKKVSQPSSCMRENHPCHSIV